ncbi:hypothetical protein NKG94_05480 [Micromonospora sp. M12]
MTALGALWSFVIVVGLLTMTPGMDTALILRTAALGKPAVRGESSSASKPEPWPGVRSPPLVSPRC